MLCVLSDEVAMVSHAVTACISALTCAIIDIFPVVMPVPMLAWLRRRSGIGQDLQMGCLQCACGLFRLKSAA